MVIRFPLFIAGIIPKLNINKILHLFAYIEIIYDLILTLKSPVDTIVLFVISLFVKTSLKYFSNKLLSRIDGL